MTSRDRKKNTCLRSTGPNKTCPPDTVQLVMQVSGSAFYYSQFPIIRFDLINAKQMQTALRTLEENKVPVFAALFPFEVEKFSEKTFKMDLIERIDLISVFKVEGL